MVKYKLLIFITLALVFNQFGKAQDWVVPDEKKAVVAPFKFDDETVKKGEVVFQKNCQSCHGNPTKGNFVPLVPPPGDPATEKFQKKTDGELFFKITMGRGAMPVFKNILNEEERWDVLSYIRSFNKDYLQPAIDTTLKKLKGKDLKIALAFLDKVNKIQVLATGVLNNERVPVKDAEITLFVKRYFGNLSIGNSFRTNDKGLALMDFPKDLPGDEKGNIELIARLYDETAFGQGEQKLILPIGRPTIKKSLTADRAMWNDSANAPIWLIITYSSIAIGVWSFIIYIFLQLRKINELGIQEKKNKPI